MRFGWISACRSKGATIRFRNDKFADPAGLVGFIQDQRGLAKIRDNKLVVRRNWADEKDRLRGAFAIARDLAKIAVEARKKAA